MSEREQTSEISDLWYKDAVLYELDVETFSDSDGDGVGDFRGLIRRLDYLAGLGVNCLWLMPFYPSPNRDDGYDVSDFYNVEPRLGTLGDFVEFTQLAREHGIRVLVDLVVNHTSDQHPWFQAARKDRHSPYRDFYLWSEKKPDNLHEGMVFPGKQEATWTYDEEAGAWYFHRFFAFQPDLNMANPAVRQEVRRIMGFWLQLGVSGFRVDAAPFIIEQQEVDRALREFREFLSWRRGDAVLLAEANVPRDRIPFYFGEGTKVHMAFNFLANQHLFLALARGEAGPLAGQLQQLPDLPPTGQWVSFLRNHDELDLGRLAADERREAFRAFAPDEDMRIFGRGIRRRLAPMLGGDRRKQELALSLMLSLPGTPVLYYGDEIGMGDDLALDGRLSVRTPMQWSRRDNGGFSTAPADALTRPVITGGDFGYRKVNVADQRRDRDSLLQWVQRAVHVRRECPEIGRGPWAVLDPGDPAVLALRCEWESGAVVVLHNLADRPAKARLETDEQEGESLVDLLGDGRYDEVPPGGPVELRPYGYRWLRVAGVGWKLP